MAFTPNPPFPKSQGDVIRSSDWNDTINEIMRLDNAKVNRLGDHITGPLTIDGNVGIGTTASGARLTVDVANEGNLALRLMSGPNAFLDVTPTSDGGRFQTVLNTVNNRDLAIVTGTGNVGIGTLTPGAKLEVIGSSWDQHLRLTNAGTGGAGPGIFFNAVNRDWAILGTNATAGAGDQKLGFYDATSGAYRMVIDPAGRVGIGTVSPVEPLEVNGRIKSGALTIGPWPANGNYMFLGTNALNQGDPANYALLQGAAADTGVTFLNSPVNVRFRIRNGDKMVIDQGSVLATVPLITQQAHTIKIGVVSPANPPRYGNDGIRGEPNLWLDAAQTVFIKQGFQAVGGFDIAERFKSVGQVHAGQVVVFDAQVAAVKLCDRAYDSRVIGIASAEPAFILGVDQEQMPIALCGRVPCNVDADIAPIAVGDLLTTSPTSGHAQKVLEHGKANGAIIGKALGALDRGKGKIPVLVMLH